LSELRLSHSFDQLADEDSAIASNVNEPKRCFLLRDYSGLGWASATLAVMQ
jgi:hypothetical protein